MSKKNPYAPKTLEAVTSTGSKVKDVEPAKAEVFDGTIKEVLEWVGDDKEKAQEIYDAETAKDKPRQTLITHLEELLTSDD